MSLRRSLILSVAQIGLIAGLAACAPIVERRGYIPDAQSVSEIEIGLDDKESVRRLLGSPTTTTTFETQQGSAWYYVSTLTERLAFYQPDVVERSIVAVYFDPKRKVTDIRRFGLEDAKVVDYNSRETPTSGKELSLLAQLFGNIGRYNPASGGGSQPGSPSPGGRIPR
ncbi:MAG: outer membrane protein assembly factor BamE [Alphaproteobacteria bacterium]